MPLLAPLYLLADPGRPARAGDALMDALLFIGLFIAAVVIASATVAIVDAVLRPRSDGFTSLPAGGWLDEDAEVWHG